MRDLILGVAVICWLTLAMAVVIEPEQTSFALQRMWEGVTRLLP